MILRLERKLFYYLSYFVLQRLRPVAATELWRVVLSNTIPVYLKLVPIKVADKAAFAVSVPLPNLAHIRVEYHYPKGLVALLLGHEADTASDMTRSMSVDGNQAEHDGCRSGVRAACPRALANAASPFLVQ